MRKNGLDVYEGVPGTDDPNISYFDCHLANETAFANVI